LGDVVPACVIDPKFLAAIDRSSRRGGYYRALVASLARDIERRDSRLVVRVGSRVQTVLRLVREAKADAVAWSASHDAAGVDSDRALQSALEEAGVRVAIAHDAPAVAPEETAAARREDGGRGYRSLAPYVSAWLVQPHEPILTRPRFVAHDLASDGDSVDTAPLPEGCEATSEAAVLSLVEAFVAGPILSYPFARNVPASDGTARISAALSFGAISARTILARIDDRLRDPFLLVEERLAIGTFVRALARRDFFLQLAWFFEDEPDAVLQEHMRAFPFAKTHAALDAWADGRTGYPLVDAGMRQLRATGWMHPRVRPIAASFVCFDLGVDWRVGRDVWDRELVEYEPALANGNWQWVCGLGADLVQFPRIYNPRKQFRTLDPRGTYVRRWVSELADVSDAELFGRGTPESRPQLTLALFDRPPYPEAVVDHERAARASLARHAAHLATRPR
jgi:deoxyribodipyrimidine photo-lyase